MAVLITEKCRFEEAMSNIRRGGAAGQHRALAAATRVAASCSMLYAHGMRAGFGVDAAERGRHTFARVVNVWLAVVGTLGEGATLYMNVHVRARMQAEWTLVSCSGCVHETLYLVDVQVKTTTFPRHHWSLPT